MVGIILMAVYVVCMVLTLWYHVVSYHHGIYGYIMVPTIWCPPSNGVTFNGIICHKWYIGALWYHMGTTFMVPYGVRTFLTVTSYVY